MRTLGLDRVHAIRDHNEPGPGDLVSELVTHRDRQSFVALAPNDQTAYVDVAIICFESPDGRPVGAMLLLPPRHSLTQHGLCCATIFGASQDAGDLARRLARSAGIFPLRPSYNLKTIRLLLVGNSRLRRRFFQKTSSHDFCQAISNVHAGLGAPASLPARWLWLWLQLAGKDAGAPRLTRPAVARGLAQDGRNLPSFRAYM